MIATCQRSISQNYCNMLWAFGHCVETCCDMHVGCCWLEFKNGQIWANSSQHVPKQWPNAGKYCAQQCWDMLRSFGRGLRLLTEIPILGNQQKRLEEWWTGCCLSSSYKKSKNTELNGKRKKPSLSTLVILAFIPVMWCTYSHRDRHTERQGDIDCILLPRWVINSLYYLQLAGRIETTKEFIKSAKYLKDSLCITTRWQN